MPFGKTGLLNPFPLNHSNGDKFQAISDDHIRKFSMDSYLIYWLFVTTVVPLWAGIIGAGKSSSGASKKYAYIVTEEKKVA